MKADGEALRDSIQYLIFAFCEKNSRLFHIAARFSIFSVKFSHAGASCPERRLSAFVTDIVLVTKEINWMSENLENIDRKINVLWTKGKFNEAYDVIIQELVPILHDYLKGESCSHADSKDIVAEALASFSKKISQEGPQSVIAPKPFLWTAVNWRKQDRWKENKKAALPESQIAPVNHEEPLAPNEYLDKQLYDGTGSHLVPTWQKRAMFMVEGLLEEAEVDESDAVVLVRETLKRMSTKHQAIITHVLEYGAAQESAEAAKQLGISQGNFRVQKSRAYAEFREVIVQVSDELGIHWRGLPEKATPAEAVVELDFYPSDDGDEDGESK